MSSTRHPIELNIPESADWSPEASRQAERHLTQGDDCRQRVPTGQSFSRALNRFDPDGRKAHQLMRRLEDPDNPDNPEHNQNPLEVKEGDIIVLNDLFDHTKKSAYEVLMVDRGWNHITHLGLGMVPDGARGLRLRVLTSHLFVEGDGKNAIHEILPPNHREGLNGINRSVIIDRVLLGHQPELR